MRQFSGMVVLRQYTSVTIEVEDDEFVDMDSLKQRMCESAQFKDGETEVYDFVEILP